MFQKISFSDDYINHVRLGVTVPNDISDTRIPLIQPSGIIEFIYLPQSK